MNHENPWMVVRRAVAEENPHGDVRTAAMADTEDGDNRYLIVQCLLSEPDAQNRRLGLDTYCLLNEEGAVHYGGVLSAVLRGRTLEFAFDDDAAAELELPGSTVALELRVPEEGIAELARGLARILTYGDPRQHPARLELPA